MYFSSLFVSYMVASILKETPFSSSSSSSFSLSNSNSCSLNLPIDMKSSDYELVVILDCHVLFKYFRILRLSLFCIKHYPKNYKMFLYMNKSFLHITYVFTLKHFENLTFLGLFFPSLLMFLVPLWITF